MCLHYSNRLAENRLWPAAFLQGIIQSNSGLPPRSRDTPVLCYMLIIGGYYFTIRPFESPGAHLVNCFTLGVTPAALYAVQLFFQ